MHVVNKHSGCKTSRIFPCFSYILKLQKAWCCPSRCHDVCSCFSVLGPRTGSKAWPCTVTSITLFHCNIEIMWLPISSKEQLKMVPAGKKATGRGGDCLLSQLEAFFSRAGRQAFLSNPACTQVFKSTCRNACLKAWFLSLVLATKSSNRNCVVI